MKTKSVFLTTITLSALTLACASGCSTHPKIAIINNTQGSQVAETKLADAADSISQSLQELAAIEKASHPLAKIPPPPEPNMIGMGQIASIDWSGPIGPLVHKIGKATNYKVHVLGTAPAIPILVSISAKDTPLSDILRDAGFQCGNKASIAIYPASKIIELRYLKI